MFDVLPEQVPVHPDPVATLSVHGRSIRIVDLETLLRLKLKAGGPKDLYDIGVLPNLNPEIKPGSSITSSTSRGGWSACNGCSTSPTCSPQSETSAERMGS